MSSPSTRAGAAIAGALLAALGLAPAASAEDGATPTPTVSVTATATATEAPTPTPTEPTEPAPTDPPSPQTSATGTTSSPEPSVPASASPTGTARVHLSAPVATGATGQQAQDAAAFIGATLAAGGDHYVYPGTTYLDGGNTIDAILALDGAGAGQREAAAATDYLVGHLGDYIGAYGETYAGPTAKALLAVLAQGRDPHDAGGIDLLATLAGLETPSGRFSDVSAYGDYSNTIGQALAVIALARAGATVSDTAVTFLADQQCPDGGFRISPDVQACTSDPDATGFAAQALLAVTTTTLDTSAPAAAALDYLLAAQAADGGVASAGGPENANTTGVAAQAFAAGGRAGALARAQGFLARLQYDCSYSAALRGGIAFSPADRTGRGATAPQDSDLRSTPQAALGLAGGTLASVGVAGGAAGTTDMICAASPTASTSSSASSSDGAGAAAPTTTAADPSSLAYTGAPVLGPVLLGLGLLGAGAAAVGVGSLLRRRGVHA